ncbi:MAG: tetratricopeptide repeat protein [Candidatus Muiribacteriota bacterium]
METKNNSINPKDLLEEAIVYHKAGEYDSAVNFYKKILSREPSNEVANNNLGIIYVTRENYDKAIECFGSILKIYPNNVDAAFNLGKAFMMKEDFINASRSFEKANKLAPRDKEVLKNLAFSYKNSGDFEKALINFRQVLNFDENDASVLYQIAEIYYLTENFERASEFCLKILNRVSEDWKARGLLADSFFYMKKFNEALDIIKKLIEDYPDNLLFREKLADYYLEKGDFSEALYQLETILSKDPGNINYLNRYREIKSQLYKTEEKAFSSELESSYEEKLKLKAKKYFEKEDYNGMIREFTTELINNSNNLFLLKSIARAYCRLENYEEAVKYYDRYLKKEKGDSEITYEYANVLNKLGNFLEAHKFTELAIQKGEINEELLLLQTENLIRLGRVEDAISLLEKNVNKICAAKIYKKLGNLYKILNNNTAAYNIWHKATKLFPENNFFNMLLAQISDEDKNYRLSLKHIKKFLENSPDDFKALNLLARNHLELKKPREAFAVWSDIIDKRPKTDYDIVIKGRILLFTERYEEALKQLELIEDKFKHTPEFMFLRGLAFLMKDDYNSCINLWNKASEIDEDLIRKEFLFISKYFDKTKLKNLLKRWNKYESEIISFRSNI